MNETLKQLKGRKSVRQYEDQPIPQALKDEILQSAFEAPTAGAMMLYSIIDVTDQGLKDKLAVACDHQSFISSAPLVLVFLADYQRWYDTFVFEGCEPRKPGQGDMLLACADAIIAAQNTVVAAESLGIGSCYIGDIIESAEEVKQLLNLPEYVLPAAMLVYGYPSESQIKRNKPARFDSKFIVHNNAYKQFDAGFHREMHTKENMLKPVNDYIQAFCQRKYMSDFALEMNRSASVYIDGFRHKLG